MCNEEKNEFQEELKEKLEAAREEAEDLIRQYGGTAAGSVSKKTS